MMVSPIFLILSTSLFAAPPTESNPDLQRANELKEYIRRERPGFEARENQKKSLTEELDRLNQDQNSVRQKVTSLRTASQELAMAVENLSMEMSKHREIETDQKGRMAELLKVTYKIRREGIFRFLLSQDTSMDMVSRVRILFYVLRASEQTASQLEARAKRLSESESKLQVTREEMQKLIVQLGDHEKQLGEILGKKRRFLQTIAQKQKLYRLSVAEYRRISKELSLLFENLEASRGSDQIIFPNHGSLPLPVELGKIVRNFGKTVHSQFRTVVFNKGIEIEAGHNSEVLAVLPGVVEYDGWVKGLGNVVILHHGGGFYSLSAHLFKSTRRQGSRVTQGETIGFVGDTGDNDKPSLYFELRENGTAVDPIAYFAPSALRVLEGG